jgi:uncharacterized surface anchored protein
MNSMTTGHRRTATYNGRVTPKANLPVPPRELPCANPAGHLVLARLVDDETGAPLAGAAYVILDATGKAIASGTTDYTGIVRKEVSTAGRYEVRLVEAAAAEREPAAEAEKIVTQEILARFVDEDTDAAIAGAKYEIVDASEKVVASGEADDEGIVRRLVPHAGRYFVRLAEADAPAEMKRAA